MGDTNNKTICLAVTGASGFRYALRLLSELLKRGCRIHCIVSSGAREVAKLEDGIVLPEPVIALKKTLLSLVGASDSAGLLTCYEARDWLSPVASGSSKVDAMVVCPCSTGSLASIALGLSDDLIKRAAVVTLKESRQLILVPRETPLSAIQLEHMHKLALMGVHILPASPGFYHQPTSIDDLVDFVVARILSQLDLPQDIMKPWS